MTKSTGRWCQAYLSCNTHCLPFIWMPSRLIATHINRLAMAAMTMFHRVGDPDNRNCFKGPECRSPTSLCQHWFLLKENLPPTSLLSPIETWRSLVWGVPCQFLPLPLHAPGVHTSVSTFLLSLKKYLFSFNVLLRYECSACMQVHTRRGHQIIDGCDPACVF